MKKIALLLPIIAGTCWGCAPLFIRTLFSAGFDNITITFSRLIVMVAVLGTYMAIFDRDALKISRHDLPIVILVGVAGFYFMNICFNISSRLLSMSLAAVMLCTAPVFVIIFSRILFNEKITKTKLLCMIAALIGCTLLSGVLDDGGLKWSMLGIAMGVATSICNAIYTMATNQAVDIRKCKPVTVTFYACTTAMLLMLPMADFGKIGNFLTEDPLPNGVFFIAHALVTSIFPNLIFTTAFKYVDSGIVSILASGAEPTSAMIFGLVIYHEVPTVFGVLGMIITITAMIILTRKKPDSLLEESG